MEKEETLKIFVLSIEYNAYRVIVIVFRGELLNGSIYLRYV